MVVFVGWHFVMSHSIILCCVVLSFRTMVYLDCIVLLVMCFTVCIVLYCIILAHRDSVLYCIVPYVTARMIWHRYDMGIGRTGARNASIGRGTRARGGGANCWRSYRQQQNVCGAGDGYFLLCQLFSCKTVCRGYHTCPVLRREAGRASAVRLFWSSDISPFSKGYLVGTRPVIKHGGDDCRKRGGCFKMGKMWLWWKGYWEI